MTRSPANQGFYLSLHNLYSSSYQTLKSRPLWTLKKNGSRIVLYCRCTVLGPSAGSCKININYVNFDNPTTSEFGSLQILWKYGSTNISRNMWKYGLHKHFAKHVKIRSPAAEYKRPIDPLQLCYWPNKFNVSRHESINGSDRIWALPKESQEPSGPATYGLGDHSHTLHLSWL
jgi:hypothetical protein